MSSTMIISQPQPVMVSQTSNEWGSGICDCFQDVPECKCLHLCGLFLLTPVQQLGDKIMCFLSDHSNVYLVQLYFDQLSFSLECIEYTHFVIITYSTKLFSCFLTIKHLNSLNYTNKSDEREIVRDHSTNTS